VRHATATERKHKEKKWRETRKTELNATDHHKANSAKIIVVPTRIATELLGGGIVNPRQAKDKLRANYTVCGNEGSGKHNARLKT
jgi:hypothetical protein